MTESRPRPEDRLEARRWKEGLRLAGDRAQQRKARAARNAILARRDFNPLAIAKASPFLNNIFIERLRRTVKYEEALLKAYAGGREARAGMDKIAVAARIEAPERAVDMPLRLDSANALPACPQQQKKHKAAARIKKHKGRKDYSVSPAGDGPADGVRFAHGRDG